MYVETGQKIVDIHDHVDSRATYLYLALIGKEGKPQQVAAIGEVWGKHGIEAMLSCRLETNFFKCSMDKKNKNIISW